MKERPKIKPQLSMMDKICEVITLAILLAIWICLIVNYSKLPETIPVHFNASGVADGFGEKKSIFSLPIVATVMFFGLFLLSRFPRILNYPKKITEENAYVQYLYATRLVRYLNFALVVIFGYLILASILNAQGSADGLGVWFTPLMLVLLFVPLIFYLIKAYRN